MKAYIGDYKRYIGPYQIAKILVPWSTKLAGKLGDFLAYGKKAPDLWGTRTRLNTFCEWLHSKRHRVVKVQLDPYDTWNADSTLALIIYPMLVQLAAHKQGYSLVDEEDVPPKFIDGADRWEYVLGEMIFAFEQVAKQTDWELYPPSSGSCA